MIVIDFDGTVGEVVPGGLRLREGEDAAEPPDQTRTRAQPLRLLQRDHERARQGLPARQAGLRRRDRSTRHPRRGVIQGLDAHHAAAPRQHTVRSPTPTSAIS